MTTHADHQHHLGRRWESPKRKNVVTSAWRFFNPAIAKPLVVVLMLLALSTVYWVALINARHQYRDLRARFCDHLVADFYARNPRLRQLPLIDSCLEFEMLTGESPR